MGITSAAEAKLDARIRPDITQLRSRTSYPRRHRPPLSAIAGGTAPGGHQASGASTTERSELFAQSSSAETISRTVRAEQTTWRVARAERTVLARAARTRTVAASDVEPARSRPARAAQADRVPARTGLSRSALASAPVRLTRRGRVVLAWLVTMIVAAAAALIWLAIAGQAQAASHVGPAGPTGHSMLRVVVLPGQTLWSIAVKADPAADPRAVIQQIVDDNALAGTAITAGQVLWVPR
jgi:hypothetical protein